jgi:hypothetical protein
LNRAENIIDIIDFTVETYKQSGPSRVIYQANGWQKCNNYSACQQQPVGFTEHSTVDCPTTGNSACLSGQAITPGTLKPLGTIAAAATKCVIFRTQPNTLDRATNTAWYRRGTGTTLGTTPDFVGSFVQLTFTHKVTVVETVDPFALPIKSPTRTPEPVRWPDIPSRQRNPARDANEQYQRGYYASDDVRNRIETGLDPTLRPAPTTLVVDVPTFGEPVLMPPGVVPPHTAAAPKPGTKEKKLVLAATGAAKTLINVVTEGKDVVDAVFKALPLKYRKGKSGLPPHKKAELIFEHFGELDAGVAITELIKNQAEDALFGRIGKIQAKTNRRASKYSRIQIGLGPAL